MSANLQYKNSIHRSECQIKSRNFHCFLYDFRPLPGSPYPLHQMSSPGNNKKAASLIRPQLFLRNHISFFSGPYRHSMPCRVTSQMRPGLSGLFLYEPGRSTFIASTCLLNRPCGHSPSVPGFRRRHNIFQIAFHCTIASFAYNQKELPVRQRLAVLFMSLW